jgi:hypothetical protein
MVIKIELNDKQEKKFKKWMEALKTIYGSSGDLTWCTSSSGIGTSIKVISSHLPDHPLDLSDTESW